jgi:predicted DNA-binding transcriptional regulator AlpA
MLSENDNAIPDAGAPSLITAAQLATKLQVSTRTLWRKLSAGILPNPLRLGGIVRWRLVEIENWIARGCPIVDAREN